MSQVMNSKVKEGDRDIWRNPAQILPMMLTNSYKQIILQSLQANDFSF